jgi:hypothetical protein
MICCIPLLFLTVILYGSRLKAKLPMEITLETSEASRQVLAALIFAVLMGTSIIFGYMQTAQGKYDEVEKLNWRALEGSEKELGAQYPSTLTSVTNLALVLEVKRQTENVVNESCEHGVMCAACTHDRSVRTEELTLL